MADLVGVDARRRRADAPESTALGGLGRFARLGAVVAVFASAVVTATTVATVIETPPAASAAATCAASTVYGLSLSGSNARIVAITTSSGATTLANTVALTGGDDLANGLALTADGSAAYFTGADGSLSSGDQPRIYRVDLNSGAVTTFSGSSLVASDASSAQAMEAGAINPVTGIYYYATSVTGDHDWQVYAFNTNTNTNIGFVGRVGPSAGEQGDLVFDELGNMYLYTSESIRGIYRVAAAALPTAAQSSSYHIPYTTVGTYSAPSSDMSGVAYQPTTNNVFMVEDSGSTAVYSGSIGGTISAGSTVATYQNIQDLASCFPPAGQLTVQKSITSRVNATDQFTVTVNDPDAGDHQLDNFVVPTGTTPPATCDPATQTCTTNPVPALVVSKTVNPVSGSTVNPGQVLTYTITFDNGAGKAAATVDHLDDLTKVLDDATVTTQPTASAGSSLVVGTISNGTFPVTGSVPAGASASVTYAVTVNDPATGDRRLDNFVVETGTNPPTDCVAGNPTCTTNPMPALVVTKSVNPASGTVVNEGQTLSYTLTFDNSAGQAAAPVAYTDDLSKILDDADITTAPATTSALVIGAVTNGTFTVTGAVPAGQTATVTYAVTIKQPDTLGDHRLTNFLVKTGTTPPTDCIAGDSTCTTNPMPGLVVSKSVNPSSGSRVDVGQQLVYTLTFDNTAGQAPAPVNVVDDLTRVVDDATVTVDPAASAGSGLTVGTVTAGTFTITGSVPAGIVGTVTYTVTVNDPATGDRLLDNFVLPSGTQPPTSCMPGNPLCTTNPMPGLVVSKSVNPASGTVVAAGQDLTYTLTFDNTSGRADATVDHTDDLSDVLDDATITTAPALASGTGLAVGAVSGGVFTVTGSVPAGTVATVTYTVHVTDPHTSGNFLLVNFVFPTGTTPPTTCDPATGLCTINPMPDLRVAKTVDPASGTTVDPGDVLTYTLSFDNTNGTAAATVDYSDVLTRVLDDATVTSAPTVTPGVGLVVGPISGGSFSVTGVLAPGASGTVTYQVTVDDPDTGDHSLDNFVLKAGETPPTVCPLMKAFAAGAIDPMCTTNPVPALVVVKAATPTSTTHVALGQSVVYTLTFDNSAGKAPATVDHLDDLTKVLDDATVTAAPAVAGGAGLTVGAISGGMFSITGAVPAGTTTTVTYTVQVNSPSSGDRMLDNYVIPIGTQPPSTCDPASSTCTTHPVDVPELDTVKAVSTVNGAPATTATKVRAGDVITYRIVTTNSGTGTGITTLTDIVPDYTTYTGSGEGWSCSNPTSAGGSCTQQVAVPAASSVAVTYTVTVQPFPATVNQIANLVTSSNGTCSSCNPSNPVPVADLEVVKTVDRASVTIGETVRFTVVLSNLGPDDAHGVTLRDVPSGLDYVSYTATQGTYDPATGTWSVGTLANQAVATMVITSIVTVTHAVNDVDAIPGAEIDPNLANNHSSASVEATPQVLQTTPLPTVPPTTKPLPVTGSNVDDTIRIGAVFVAVGVGIMVIVRRRRRRRPAA